jgi:hypothetical protein
MDHREILHFLHTRGGDIECQNEWTGTPLEDAAATGDLLGVQNLLAEGANVHVPVIRGVRHKNDNMPKELQESTKNDSRIIAALTAVGAQEVP